MEGESTEVIKQMIKNGYLQNERDVSFAELKLLFTKSQPNLQLVLLWSGAREVQKSNPRTQAPKTPSLLKLQNKEKFKDFK